MYPRNYLFPSTIKAFLYILLLAAAVLACKEDPVLSKEVRILELTLTINKADHEVKFSDKSTETTLFVPFAEGKAPDKATVKKLSVSPEATANLKTGGTLIFSNGKATIDVVAEDKKTSQKYSISLNNNLANTLSSIQINFDGNKIKGEITNDTVTFNFNAIPTKQPVLETIDLPQGATSSIKVGDKIEFNDQNTATITITAQDGKTTKKYVLVWSNKTLTAIKAIQIDFDGNKITGAIKNDTVTFYLNDNPTKQPALEAIELSQGATSSIKVGDKIEFNDQNTAIITITAQDGKTTKKYLLRWGNKTLTAIKAIQIDFDGNKITGAIKDDTITFLLGFEPTSKAILHSLSLPIGATSNIAINGIVEFKANKGSIVVTAANKQINKTYVLKLLHSIAELRALTLSIAGEDKQATIQNKRAFLALKFLDPGDRAFGYATIKDLTLPQGASATPTKGQYINFTDGKSTITVTAEDGKTKQIYNVELENTRTDLGYITLTTGENDKHTIAPDKFNENGEYTLKANLSATPQRKPVTVTRITGSAFGTKISVKKGDTLTFDNNDVATIKVTSQHGVNAKTYTIKAQNTANQLLSVKLTYQENTHIITKGDFDQDKKALLFLEQTPLPSNGSFTVSEANLPYGASLLPANGQSLKFANGKATMTVTAQNSDAVQYTIMQETNDTLKIFSFGIRVADNPNIGISEEDGLDLLATIDNNDEVHFNGLRPYMSGVSFKPFFVVAPGVEVTVNNVQQVTGQTQQDFSGDIVYTLKKNNKSKQYTVKGLLANLAQIPDKYFRDFLKAKYADAFTGDLLKVDNANVRNATIITANRGEVYKAVGKYDYIKYLTGIEFFTNVEKLYAIEHKLQSLDISKNTKLTHLEVSSNDLSSLNTSNNLELKYLAFGFNSRIQNIDIKHLTKLNDFLASNCDLVAVDVSKNTNLEKLAINFNKVRELDLSHNLRLKNVICQSNRLISLNLSGIDSLASVSCPNNMLTELTITSTWENSFRTLNCGGNQLREINITGILPSLLTAPFSIDIKACSNDKNPVKILKIHESIKNNSDIKAVKINCGASVTISLYDDNGNVVCADYDPTANNGAGQCK